MQPRYCRFAIVIPAGDYGRPWRTLRGHLQENIYFMHPTKSLISNLAFSHERTTITCTKMLELSSNHADALGSFFPDIYKPPIDRFFFG